MSTEQNKILVQRFLTEVWLQGNLDNLEEMIAANHVHHLTRRKLYGLEGVQELAVQFRTFLTDVQITIHDLLADGDKVVTYFTFSGIDQGGTMGHPPSGKRVSFAGIDIFQVADDQIVARWGIVDLLSVFVPDWCNGLSRRRLTSGWTIRWQHLAACQKRDGYCSWVCAG